MKRSGNFNDITPKNDSLEKSKNEFSVSSKNLPGNSVKTEDVYKIDNNASARTRKAKKKAKGIADMIKAFALTASTVMLGIVGVQIASPPGVYAEFVELEATEDSVFYYVETEENATGLKVVLYNDFTNREQQMEEQGFGGVFEGLQKNMYYTIAVKKGSKTITKKRVYTKSQKPIQEPSDNNPTTGDDPTGANP